ncbi:lysin [Lactobacillus phage ATCC 8014-B2]|uniref:lysozyme n=1 Tax=Lactobacillus phage ATCC 8014-B2 TaxID=1225795 RepID=K4I1Y4_9CAUD|nr:endolysin [Lactobacillus phage ATCC 8014-B2]AFU63107.1 lysin [Lactobacillus phage ATCC 8014-B2]
MNKRLKHVLYGTALALSLGLSASAISTQNASAANTSDGAIVKKVVDISEWQGNVSYQKALALKSETSFVIVRVQYGSNYQDVQYKNTIANLEKAGTPYGVYSYSRYVNASDAKQEAKDLYSRAKNAKFFVNDAEEVTTTSGSYSSAVKAWGAEMQSLTSKPVILYSGSYFYNNYIGTMSNYDAFWEANYSNHYLKDPALWQYTDSGYSTSLGLGVDTNKVITSKHPVKWWIGSSAADKQNVDKYHVGGFKVGDKVKINSNVAKWDAGDTKTPIDSSVLKKTYTVGQIKQVTEGKSNQMLLLKSGNTVVGWTLAEHVTKQGSSSNSSSSNSNKASSQTYNQNGTFYPNTTLNVRTGAGTNYSKVATYYSGESVKYNQVIIKSDYVWARYLRSNGYYGYIALGVSGGESYGKRVVGSSHTYYTVKSGDSLWKIANDHGTTISNLTSLNGISMYSTIYPNQRLIIS